MSTKQFLSAAIFLGTGCLLFAADAPQQDQLTHKVQVSETKRIAFPQGSTLRFSNSMGVLTVEAWDRPEVEITTIKSTKAAIGAGEMEKARHTLDKVTVSSEQHGGELVVATIFPRHRPFRLPYPFSGNTGFDLEYRIKAPASARIVADHTLGEVNIDGVTGDIQVTVAQGQISLHLPEEQKYTIQARCQFGSVNSDFSEPERRTRWFLGHVSAETAAAPHKLNLKVGFGDIVILKTRLPKYPEPEAPAPKADGL